METRYCYSGLLSGRFRWPPERSYHPWIWLITFFFFFSLRSKYLSSRGSLPRPSVTASIITSNINPLLLGLRSGWTFIRKMTNTSIRIIKNIAKVHRRMFSWPMLVRNEKITSWKGSYMSRWVWKILITKLFYKMIYFCWMMRYCSIVTFNLAITLDGKFNFIGCAFQRWNTSWNLGINFTC